MASWFKGRVLDSMFEGHLLDQGIHMQFVETLVKL
jgi:hypothetical protein